MPYDETLAGRVRAALPAGVDLREQAMFGGLCWMIGGNMCVGLTRDELMVRLDPQGADDVLALEHASPVQMGGRTMRSMAVVDPAGTASEQDLQRWVDLGVAHARSLPPKAPRAPRAPRAGKARTGSPARKKAR